MITTYCVQSTNLLNILQSIRRIYFISYFFFSIDKKTGRIVAIKVINLVVYFLFFKEKLT